MKRCPQCNRAETDEALKFCRVDGATLVDESGSLGSESSTAQLGSAANSSEIHTSMLPHKTDAGVSRATGPTTALPQQTPPPATTGSLAKPKSRKAIVIAVVITSVFAAVAAMVVNSYRSRLSGTAINSIAVMPFVNESGNADVEYLSDGMTETLMNSLSQLSGLSVKARSSAFRYKGKETDAQTIGKELGVQAILNGRVVKRGDNLALFLELVETNTGNRIWGEQYNEPIANLLTLQNHIARDVSQKLSNRLSGADQKKLTKNYTKNAEAYQLYLQGRYLLNKRTPEAFRTSIPFFERALASDPNYALAHTGLADTYALLGVYGGGLPPHEAMPKAKAAAQKALALDPDLAEAHESLAHVLSDYEFDFAGAEQEYKRAIELNPNLASAHQWYGEMLTESGRFEEGMAEIQRALDLDPLSLINNRVKGRNLIFAGKFDQGIEQIKRTVALDVSFPAPHGDLAMVYQIQGKYAESVDELAIQMELLGDKSNSALVKESFSKGGWRAFLMLMTDKSHRFPTLTAFELANFYISLGDKESAISSLKKAYDEGTSDFRSIKVDPRYDPIRNDPRVQELYRKAGLP